MLSKDEIKGNAKKFLGAVKENLGWLTDDHKAEDEGKASRIEGEHRAAEAKVRREADDAAESE